MKLLLSLLCVWMAGVSAHAIASQAIWRCDGNSYSSQPCKQGRQVDAGTAPTAQEQRNALEVADREQRLARSMVQERRERDRELRDTMGNGLTGFGTAAPSDHASLTQQTVQPPRRPKHQAAKTLRDRPRLATPPQSPSSGLGKMAAAAP